MTVAAIKAALVEAGHEDAVFDGNRSKFKKPQWVKMYRDRVRR